MFRMFKETFSTAQRVQNNPLQDVLHLLRLLFILFLNLAKLHLLLALTTQYSPEISLWHKSFHFLTTLYWVLYSNISDSYAMIIYKDMSHYKAVTPPWIRNLPCRQENTKKLVGIDWSLHSSPSYAYIHYFSLIGAKI